MEGSHFAMFLIVISLIGGAALFSYNDGARDGRLEGMIEGAKMHARGEFVCVKVVKEYACEKNYEEMPTLRVN